MGCLFTHSQKYNHKHVTCTLIQTHAEEIVIFFTLIQHSNFHFMEDKGGYDFDKSDITLFLVKNFHL